MSRKAITTMDELRKLQGKKVTCRIRGNDIKDCTVNVAGDNVYLCQNVESGSNRSRLPGYEYSWMVDSDEYLNSSVFNLFLAEEDEYYYYEAEGDKSSELFRPIAVYVSNTSEKDAVKDKAITWLLGRKLTGEFITWDEQYDSISELLEAPIDGCTEEWNYAVPVTKSSEKIVKLVIIEDGKTREAELTAEQKEALNIN